MKACSLKITFLIRYAPDQYKIQQMNDQAILENGGELEIKKCVIKQLIITLMH